MREVPFISIEGLDGAGKTTVKKIILEELTKAGFEYINTREPGGTVIAEKIRDIVKSNDPSKYNEEPICIETETLLFFASRMQNVNLTIKPFLKEGKAVLCDRFSDSTIAYQSARGMDMNKIIQLNETFLGDFKPDLTIYLDIDLTTSKSRVLSRGVPDRIEVDADNFFEKARNVYLEIEKIDPERFKKIDSMRNLDDVLDEARAVTANFLKNFKLSLEIKKKQEARSKSKMKL